MKTMSIREKVFVIVTVFLAVFYVYMTFILDPLMKTVNKNMTDIVRMNERLIQYTRFIQANPMLSKLPEELNVLPREDQLSYLVTFLYTSIRENSIKLESLRQASGEKKLILDLSISGKYTDLVNFLNGLSSCNTYFLIESATVTHSTERVTADMRITSPFK